MVTLAGEPKKRNRIQEGVAAALAAAGNKVAEIDQALTVSEDIKVSENDISGVNLKGAPDTKDSEVPGEVPFEDVLTREEYEKRQARILGRIVLDRNISHADFRVFAVLCLYQDWNSGVCWPSLNELVKISGIAKSTIRCSLKNLEKNKYITVRKTKFQTYYTLYPFNADNSRKGE